MNSKFFFAILFVVNLFSSCGVKNDPIPPGGVYMPSVETPYLQTPEEEQDKKEQKKKDKE